MNVPRFFATKADYPNIHKDHDGRAVPEALGLCSLLAADTGAPGAIEAVYVNTVTHEYLALAASAHAIPQVYGNGKLISSAGYDIVYKDGGRTYIKFGTSKGNKIITFNCEGYFYEDWNSANGYIQNPALIALFYFAFIVGVAQDDLNMESFLTLAAYFEDKGWDEAGKLILQDEASSSVVLQELLFSMGAKYWRANDGRMTVGRRDISGWQSAPTIFVQLDVLADPEKPNNFDLAINKAPYTWDYYPAATAFRGADVVEQLDSQELYGVREGAAWEFKWITDELMAEDRAQEELARLAYGNSQAKFPLPFSRIEDLDIFSLVRLQDPFGINVLGTGDPGHIYIITELACDAQNNKLDIVAEDAEWAIAAYAENGQPAYDESGSMVYPEAA